MKSKSRQRIDLRDPRPAAGIEPSVDVEAGSRHREVVRGPDGGGDAGAKQLVSCGTAADTMSDKPKKNNQILDKALDKMFRGTAAGGNVALSLAHERRLTMKAMTVRRVLLAASGTLLSALTIGAGPALAQLNGANILGDTGVETGTQPPPGFWVGGLYYHYRTDSIRKADGSKLALDPTQPSSLSIPAFAPTFAFVTKGTLLGGAHYGAFVAPGVTNASLEAPGFGFGTRTSTGPADTYIVPAQLGWHFARADAITAFGIWAPTGRYTAGATINNTGRGMWTYEGSGGATLYLDSAKTWSAATSAYFETHGKKRGTAMNVGPTGQLAFGGVRVGDILSLEGGFARRFVGGAAHAGVAYYAQWKLTNDDFGLPVTAPDGTVLQKHRVFAAGPDVTVPIGSKSTLFALVNVRYFWEMGAEVKTQGNALVLTTIFPVPSMKVK